MTKSVKDPATRLHVPAGCRRVFRKEDESVLVVEASDFDVNKHVDLSHCEYPEDLDAEVQHLSGGLKFSKNKDEAKEKGDVDVEDEDDKTQRRKMKH